MQFTSLFEDFSMRFSLWFAMLALLVINGRQRVAAQTAVAEPPVETVAAAAIPTALQDYVGAADSSYKYNVDGMDRVEGCTVHKLTLVSQTWHDIEWTHALYIYVPEDPQYTRTVLLFITGGRTGGKPGDEDIRTGCALAKLANLPVAFLHQVPNQPLLGDRVEDDLISETFLRYLETQDATWPLLFPMVKSATSAMTAIQDYAEERYDVDVQKFVVTGGSKRGWTTWLSAAADERVAAIAPIVIDTLNFAPQMKHQLEMWGEFSEQIADYTTKGLVNVMTDKPQIPLWAWVDPYTYRSELTLPKLIVNGTNDRYWTIDATSLYWNELVGEKHIRYVPNAGHGLDGGREGALATIAAFARHVAADEAMPELAWAYVDGDGQVEVKISASAAPKSVRIWQALSGTKDFREAKWQATEIASQVTSQTGGNGGADGPQYVGVVKKPATGYVAYFGEATFADGPLEYNLSTLLRQE
jgi:PhoPQ-activated pathogenicity-related protein